MRLRSNLFESHQRGVAKIAHAGLSTPVLMPFVAVHLRRLVDKSSAEMLGCISVDVISSLLLYCLAELHGCMPTVISPARFIVTGRGT